MSSESHFRIAKPKDAMAIQSLYLELVNDSNIHVLPDCIAAIANDESNLLIVGDKMGKIVATALITICHDVMYGDQPFAVVENVVVSESERGQGIGSELMNWIKETCKARRCTKIMLLSSAKRPEAHEFFERHGYQSELKRGFVNYINR
jgi:GNAT superfamily N-acetyltransferase